MLNENKGHGDPLLEAALGASRVKDGGGDIAVARRPLSMVAAGHGDPLLKVALVGPNTPCKENRPDTTTPANDPSRPLHCDAELKDHKMDRVEHQGRHHPRVAAREPPPEPDTTDESFSKFVQEVFGDELL